MQRSIEFLCRCGAIHAGRRRSLVVATSVALALSGLLASVGVAASALDSRAATHTCADGRAIHASLGARDLAFIRRFDACVAGALRRQIGLRLRAPRAVSRAAAAVLRTFAAADAQHSTATVLAEGQRVIHRFCRARGAFATLVGDSAPRSELTAASLGAGIGRFLFSGRPPIGRRASGVFGFAAGRGTLFHGRSSPDSVSVVIYALYCPTPLR